MAAASADELREYAVFADLGDRDLGLLCDGVEPADIDDGAEIFKEGGAADCAYIVRPNQSGTAVASKAYSTFWRDAYGPGSIFGDFSLRSEVAHATITACSPTEGMPLRLLKISKKKIDSLPAAVAKRVMAGLKEQGAAALMRRGKREQLASTAKLFSNCHLLNALTHGERDQLAEIVERVELASGELLVAEGAQGDDVWFVEEGELVVVGGPLPGKPAPDEGEVGAGKGEILTSAADAASSARPEPEPEPEPAGDTVGGPLVVGEDALFRSIEYRDTIVAAGVGPIQVVRLGRLEFERCTG